MHILIVNAVASNPGDAAILEGLVRALRSAFGDTVRITVSDDEPHVARRLYPDIDFVPGLHGGTRYRADGAATLVRSLRRRRLEAGLLLLPHLPRLARRLLDDAARAQLERFAAVDAVVATGGTYLVEHYPMQRRLDELRAAQLAGAPTFLFTQSLGPFRKRRTRAAVAEALAGARAIFLRDERSRAHLRQLGIPEARLHVCADAAFALAEAAPAAAPTPTPAPAPAEALRVAISVRQWRHFARVRPTTGHAAYRTAVAATVRALHRRGASITFVSTCQGVPEYRTDDSRFARQLVADLLPDLDDVHIDTTFRRPAELVEHLRGFDLVVATRMHLGILAVIAGVPVVPIAYEFKTSELFASLGMPELVVDIETITPQLLTMTIERALDGRGELRARLRAALPALRASALRPAALIRAELEGATT